MHGHIAHFAINADDLPATRRFYEGLFGWSFVEAYPGFLRSTDAGGAIAAIQKRRELGGVSGVEVTFEADSAARVAELAPALGGQVVMPESEIPGVGRLVFVADPSGNVVGAIHYHGRDSG